MSPIKVEDESEEIMVIGGRSHRRNQIRQNGQTSRRESSNNPIDREMSNKKYGTASTNSKKPPAFAAQGGVRYSLRAA